MSFDYTCHPIGILTQLDLGLNQDDIVDLKVPLLLSPALEGQE